MFLSCIWNRQCWYYCSLSQGKEDEQKPRLPQDSHALTCLKCQALLIFITWNIVWMVRDPKIHCHFLKIRGSLSHMFISLVSQMVTNLPAMLETQVRSLGWGGHLEKGMATHSSALAWRSPWREEPGEIQSVGSGRVGMAEWLHYHTRLCRQTWAPESTSAWMRADRSFHVFILVLPASTLLYWVGQNLCLGFSIRCNGKTRMNLLANPIKYVRKKGLIMLVFKSKLFRLCHISRLLRIF